MALKISTHVRGATRRDEETGVYVSFCPALRIYSQGASESRARAALESAVELFLSSCFKNGTLERALKERGFTEVRGTRGCGASQETEEFIQIERFDEPFEFEVPLYLFSEQEKRVHYD